MTRFLLTYLLHSSILLTLVLLLTRFSVFRRASVRDVLCKMALLTGIFTALPQPFVVLPNATMPISFEGQVSQSSEDSMTNPLSAGTSLKESVNFEGSSSEKTPQFSWLFWLLGGSSLLFILLRFGQALLLLRTILNAAQPVSSERLKSFVSQHSPDAKLLSSEKVSTPLAIGRRMILLPQNLESQFNLAELQSILLHEVAHLKRCDPLWNTGLSLLAHLFFFQPLNFVVRRAWRQASEELCDAHAVSVTSDRLSLAKSLVQIVRQQTSSPQILASAMAPQTHLSQRITAILEKKEQHMKRIQLTGFALLMLIGGCLLPVFTTAQIATKTVVIDAAHGGNDPGVTGFANEAEVVLQVAKKLKGLLESRGMTVVMTREGDTSLSLAERAQLVTDETAAYVSIHANSATSSSIKGVETSIFDTSGLSGGETPKTSRLAQLIQKRLTTETGAKDRGVTRDSFYVLRQNPDLAVLVTIGFLSNEEEGNKLVTETYQQQIAEAMAEAIIEYLQ